MTILSTFGGTSGVDTGDIGHSLRFRNAAGAYLSKTFGSPPAGIGRIWTISFWCKRTRAGTDEILFGARNGAAGPFLQIGFASTNRLFVGQSDGTNWIHYQETARLFRDPTSWYHITITLDTTVSSPAADRLKIFVNNERDTAAASPVTAQNAQWSFAYNTVVSAIGALYQTSGTLPIDGYLSRVCFVDGTALTPSSFGYLNTEINEWVSKSQSEVKAVVDAGGTNSFMLDFDDATSLTTLGYDKSSKGNNWTLNNFSLTAGTTYDHMLDVPGNSFATLNPIIPSAASITNGSLTSGATAVRATQNALAYDCKWEVTASGSAVTAGVISATGTTNTTTVTANKCFAFRMTTAGSLDYKNVTDGGSWTSITTGLSGEQYPYGTTAAANWNFGQAPLHASATWQASNGGYFYDTTSGYKALCQRNMPDGESITTSGSFTGTLAADGPYVDIKGIPTAMTINGNAVTFGTHADKTAFGFKLRTASSSYNNTGSNTYSVSTTGAKRKYSLSQGNP